MAYGGRGGARSWSFARAAIIKAYSALTVAPLRIGCFREYQKSITDSVYQLLCDQIEMMGLAPWFRIYENSLYTADGSSYFLFEGLHANVNKIKSLEGVQIAWVEEAETVTEESWRTLVPTIRKKSRLYTLDRLDEAEIWVTFNSRDRNDPTSKRFILNPPPAKRPDGTDYAIIKKITWRDNPWFYQTSLPAEREYLERTDHDAYLHVWEGEFRSQSDAQIFRGKYVVESFTAGGVGWDGPYFGADWGFSQDPTVLVKCWICANRLYIEAEAWGLKVDLNKTGELFATVPGARGALIRADNSRPETISYMRGQDGWGQVIAAEKWSGSVEDGIAILRQFDQIVIHPRCVHTVEEARLYSYKLDRLTDAVTREIIDKHNHCWDAVRYALQPIIKSAASMGLFNFIKQKVEAANAKKDEAKKAGTDPRLDPKQWRPTGSVR